MGVSTAKLGQILVAVIRWHFLYNQGCRPDKIKDLKKPTGSRKLKPLVNPTYKL